MVRSRSVALALAAVPGLIISLAFQPKAPSAVDNPALLPDCSAPQSPTSNEESITCTTPRPNTVVWRIDRPNIRQHQTTYSNIRFQQGDLVSVFAGGCAQTGGFGQTWKRFVNPMTLLRNDDDSFHGLITVPGFSSLGPMRDAVVQGGIPVLADPGDAAALTLGYVDDNYGDNGYASHDDGLFQQCNDLPDAWVVIAIQHGCAASPAPECIRGRALDLVADAHDDNGFPINPDWVWRRLTGASPVANDVCGWSTKIGGFPTDDASLCTSQSTQHDNAGVCVQGGTAGQIAGHMNWTETPVTYTGWVWWDGHDYYWDDDYTLNLASLDETGHVTGSLFLEGQTNPQTEFSSDETVDQITDIPWWDALHRAVNTEDELLHTANAVVSGAKMPADMFPADTRAIVIGQLGLDCAHSCNSELHPAWAVFVHTKVDLHDDTWAFFVRNWGNEGFCSTGDHKIQLQQITVRLPRPDALAVQLRLPETIAGMTAPTTPFTVSMAPGGGGALATFSLPPADQHGMVFGELHLDWKLKPGRAMLARIAAAPIDLSAIASHRPQKDSAKRDGGLEQDLTRRLERLPRAARDSLVASHRRPPPPPLRRLTGRVTEAGRTTPPAPILIRTSPARRASVVGSQRIKAANVLQPDSTRR